MLYEEVTEELKHEVQSTISTVQQLYNFFQNFNKVTETDTNTQQAIHEVLKKDVNDFSFTGQYTDLCYFSQSDIMPISAIAKISDENVKNAVVDNFDKCINNGLLEIKDNCLNITNKGRKVVNQKAFIQQAKKDQIEAYNLMVAKMMNTNLQNNEVQMCVGLTGDYVNDFTVFNHTDKINLTEILNHPNRDLSQKILENVKQWANKGAVTFEKGTVKITDAGKKMLNMPEFKSSVVPLIEKAVGSAGITGKVIVATKKVLDATIKAAKSVNNNLQK